MSGDLEDFLKRAAALRQQKAAAARAAEAEAQAAAARSTPRPYSNRNRERQAQLDVPRLEELLDAEEIVTTRRGDVVTNPRPSAPLPAPSPKTAATPFPIAPTGPSVSPDGLELFRLMRQPGGMRKAFLLSEILRRPKF